MRTDGRTDVTTVISALRDYAKAPKIIKKSEIVVVRMKLIVTVKIRSFFSRDYFLFYLVSI
jgi:hypothetical protein